MLQAAWDANHQGIEFAKKEDWANAIASYQASLAKNPDDPVVRKNLAQAQSRFANDRGLAAYNKGDWASATAFFQEALGKNPYPENTGGIQNNLTMAQSELQSEQAKQQDKAAAAVMQQSIQNFAQSLNAKPAARRPDGGGLDFITTTPVAGGGAKPGVALEFGDPMIVDLRNTNPTRPNDALRDAVAEKPKDTASLRPMDDRELVNLEQDLEKRLSQSTDPQETAWLEAQLAWTLQQKGDFKGAVQAIEKASVLDPGSSLLKLLNTSANASTKEELADAVFAAQEYLNSHPGNRVAAGILAEADGKLRQALAGTTPGGVSATQQTSLPLVPFAHQGQHSTAELDGSAEAAKAKADKDFGFQDFGKQSHAPHWQEPPPLDKRIQDSLDKNPARYPELKQNLEKRAALVAESKAADPDKTEKLKEQIQLLDKETAKKTQEILKVDFPAADDLDAKPTGSTPPSPATK